MKHVVIFIFFLTNLTVWVKAQNEDQFLPSEIKQLTVITEPATLKKGFFKISMEGFYASLKRIFNDDKTKELIPGAAISRASWVGLSSSFGITDRLEAGLYIPYMLNKHEVILMVNDPVTSTYYQSAADIKGFGLGDLSLELDAQLIKENDHHPSVSLRTTLSLPTGRKNPTNIKNDWLEFDEATGSGELSLDVSTQLRKIRYPFSFVIIPGMEYKFGGEKIHSPGEEPMSFKSGNVYYTTAGINFHLNDWMCMTNDIEYASIGRSMLGGNRISESKWELTWMPYIYFQIKKLRLAQGFIVPLMGRNTGADTRYVLVINYIL